MAAESKCQVIQVETNVVVPVELVSDCVEPAAKTLRPKLQRHLPRFERPVRQSILKRHSYPETVQIRGVTELRIGSTEGMLDELRKEGMCSTVPAVAGLQGGEVAALRHLTAFLERDSSMSLPLTTPGGIWHYGNGKANDPANPHTSGLSPFLHFGHISPLHVALAVKAVTGNVESSRSSRTSGGASSSHAFLEELIVRRELARNMCYFNPDNYDSFECLPNWARNTLEAHIEDERAVTYTMEELERGETADVCWNAAQWEMVCTGHVSISTLRPAYCLNAGRCTTI